MFWKWAWSQTGCLLWSKGLPVKDWTPSGRILLAIFNDVTGVENDELQKEKKNKCKEKIFSHCNWIWASCKHVMCGSLRCLKNLYFHNTETNFFVPEPLWNSDKEKLLNFRKHFFYCSVISPFAINLFLLPFSSHCLMQNIDFSDSGYVIKPPQPSSAIYGAPRFTVYCQKWWDTGQNVLKQLGDDSCKGNRPVVSSITSDPVLAFTKKYNDSLLGFLWNFSMH